MLLLSNYLLYVLYERVDALIVSITTVIIVLFFSSFSCNYIFVCFQYRYGVDAVWTGKGLPSEEMSFHQRLGLPEGTTKGKLIRRAYHKKSLEWHPDRWSSMINSVAGASQKQKQRGQEGAQTKAEAAVGEFSASLYTLAVQGAFELVVEAYKALMAAAGGASGSGRS